VWYRARDIVEGNLAAAWDVCPVMKATTSSIEGPAYWLRRAEEARRTADEMADPVSKKTLLDIAKAYDELAAFAAGKRNTDQGGSQDPTQI
jgi:hypothetical protein